MANLYSLTKKRWQIHTKVLGNSGQMHGCILRKFEHYGADLVYGSFVCSSGA